MVPMGCVRGHATLNLKYKPETPRRDPNSAQVYLITELLTGGELLDAVLQRGSYNEADARACFLQLLRGIEYLHAKCARQPTARFCKDDAPCFIRGVGKAAEGHHCNLLP